MRLNDRSLCESSTFLMESHRRATASKVFSHASIFCCFVERRCCVGSMPLTRSFLTLSLTSRASDKPSRGYAPAGFSSQRADHEKQTAAVKQLVRPVLRLGVTDFHLGKRHSSCPDFPKNTPIDTPTWGGGRKIWTDYSK